MLVLLLRKVDKGGRLPKMIIGFRANLPFFNNPFDAIDINRCSDFQ
ncbi:MAG: hypothetical protein ACI92E_003048 [Oceanicoccus sp.]|jgi:hypothetical protein